MTNERNVASILNSHNPKKLPIIFQPPKYDTIFNFFSEFFRGHVWLMPTVCRNNSFICLCSIIYDFKYPVEV